MARRRVKCKLCGALIVSTAHELSDHLETEHRDIAFGLSDLPRRPKEETEYWCDKLWDFGSGEAFPGGRPQQIDQTVADGMANLIGAWAADGQSRSMSHRYLLAELGQHLRHLLHQSGRTLRRVLCELGQHLQHLLHQSGRTLRHVLHAVGQIPLFVYLFIASEAVRHLWPNGWFGWTLGTLSILFLGMWVLERVSTEAAKKPAKLLLAGRKQSTFLVTQKNLERALHCATQTAKQLERGSPGHRTLDIRSDFVGFDDEMQKEAHARMLRWREEDR